MASVLHPSKISNIDSVMFVNRIRKMVSFELGKEIVKDIFALVPSVGQRNIFHFLDTVNICVSIGVFYIAFTIVFHQPSTVVYQRFLGKSFSPSMRGYKHVR